MRFEFKPRSRATGDYKAYCYCYCYCTLDVTSVKCGQRKQSVGGTCYNMQYRRAKVSNWYQKAPSMGSAKAEVINRDGIVRRRGQGSVCAISDGGGGWEFRRGYEGQRMYNWCLEGVSWMASEGHLMERGCCAGSMGEDTRLGVAGWMLMVLGAACCMRV